jgi:alkanesulfonate monooxygenase SsuD/methylene tetrahydromethanopterin reductase-like flavin-dependent oxidoreductase (luciferase family)
MKFGVSPSPHLWWKDIKDFKQWILEAENSGYDAIFIADHYNLPLQDFLYNDSLDAWSTLSFIAARTKRVKVGTCVTPIPRYVPSQLAKVIATVDILSKGRVIAGFGAGWFPEEFISYSPQGVFDKPRVRTERFLEGLQIMIKLWTEDKVTFNGKYYKLKDAELLPKPKQKPHPPLWSGGLGSRMLKFTAKYFSGWILPRGGRKGEKVITPLEYGQRVETIKKHLKDYGRSSDMFTFALLEIITERLDNELKNIEKFLLAGCNYCIVEMRPPTKNIELLRKFTKEVMPSF